MFMVWIENTMSFSLKGLGRTTFRFLDATAKWSPLRNNVAATAFNLGMSHRHSISMKGEAGAEYKIKLFLHKLIIATWGMFLQ